MKMATLITGDGETQRYYRDLNADASGEYRASKYNRELGTEFPSLKALPRLDVETNSFDDIAAVLERDGVVVLANAIAREDLYAASSAHRALMEVILPELIEVRRRCNAEQQGGAAKAFYKAEVQRDGLRVRSTAPGRLDLKDLGRRDAAALARDFGLGGALDPLALPPHVVELLRRGMGCAWRVMRIGSLPTDAGAVGGDWHRDIGEGLFGEDFDLQLPDYYFNALVPLLGGSEAEDNDKDGGDDCRVGEHSGCGVIGECGVDEEHNCGGTEFVVGSHRVGLAGIKGCERRAALAQPGDVVFFNGKLAHRGQPNGPRRRDLLYVVYAARWFEQNRDPAKESCWAQRLTRERADGHFTSPPPASVRQPKQNAAAAGEAGGDGVGSRKRSRPDEGPHG